METLNYDEQLKKLEEEAPISGKKRFIEIFSVLKENNVLSWMNPQKFRKILEELGPTFIKIGQILSNRPDMLPQEYIDELSKLRSDVNPMSYEEVVEIIEEQYQKKIHEVFLSLEHKAIGSASIAQVHKAKLLNGDLVVVKVQRKNIKNIMTSDINVLKKVCHVLKLQQFFKNIISLDDALDELIHTAYEEMNFLKEASYMDEFRQLNKDVAYIKIPKVYTEYSCEKVLVMEFISGTLIADREKLLADGYDLLEIGSKLANNYIYQAIDCGVFHADPHPDNIFIEDGRIVYLDFGMVGRINSRDKQLLENCIIAILEDDILEVERNLLILGDVKGEVNHTKLRHEIENILNKNKAMAIQEINITYFANEMLNMLGSNNITLPKDITMLVRGIVVLEGTLETVSPSINLMQVLKNRCAGSTFKEMFKKDNWRSGVKDTIVSLNSLRKIPSDIHAFFNEATRGEVKFNVEVTDSNKQIDRLEKMVHRIVVCALDVAFIVGASLIASNEVITSEQEFLYYLYIILGTIFTIWLFIKMYIDKLNRKK